MSTNVQPAIVLVHGAWHVPEHYAPFVQRLEQAGFQVVCPLLPTCDKDKKREANMYADAEAVRKEVAALLDQSRQVIMLLHSYGGAVGTQAIKGLSDRERAAQGLKGGVVHIIYMAAFMLQAGESVGGASLPRPVPEPVEMDEESGTTFLCEPPIELLFADLDPGTAKKMEALLVRQSAPAMADTLEHECWREIPSTYLMATQDKVLFPDWQERQIKAVKEAGATLDVEVYDSSHSPYLSMPEKMVASVEKIAAKVNAK